MKNLFYDMLNGLTLADFTFIALQLFTAILLGLLVRTTCIFGKKQYIPSLLTSVLIPLTICFLIIIAKNSAPMAIAIAGLCVLVGKIGNMNNIAESLLVLVLGLVGFGCGSGFVLATIFIYAFLILPIIYFFDFTK